MPVSKDNNVFDQLSTMGDFVRWGASLFNEAKLTFGHGTDNALDESFYLVSFAMHLPRDVPAYMIETKLTHQEKKAVYDLLQKRIDTRKPAAYITNEAWFAGVSFYVDERVLIPRSPIAELIEAGFEPWIDAATIEDILDLCTGCGCIAITSALAFPEARVDATDLSPEAIKVAQKNIKRHHVEDHLNLYKGDLYQGLEGRTYDVIVSNPPYVDAEDMSNLPTEYHHEPQLALAAGQDGLDIVRRILKEADHYLKPGGVLIVEVGNSAAALIDNYPKIPFTWLEFERGGHGVFMLTAEQVRLSQF